MLSLALSAAHSVGMITQRPGTARFAIVSVQGLAVTEWRRCDSAHVSERAVWSFSHCKTS